MNEKDKQIAKALAIVLINQTGGDPQKLQQAIVRLRTVEIELRKHLAEGIKHESAPTIKH